MTFPVNHEVAALLDGAFCKGTNKDQYNMQARAVLLRGRRYQGINKVRKSRQSAMSTIKVSKVQIRLYAHSVRDQRSHAALIDLTTRWKNQN